MDEIILTESNIKPAKSRFDRYTYTPPLRAPKEFESWCDSLWGNYSIYRTYRYDFNQNQRAQGSNQSGGNEFSDNDYFFPVRDYNKPYVPYKYGLNKYGLIEVLFDKPFGLLLMLIGLILFGFTIVRFLWMVF